MPTTMIIDDSTPNDVLFDPRFARGAEPRDFNVDPPSMFSPPSEAELIPESEWDARIDEQEEKQTSLEHLWRRYWKDDVANAHLDQNGQGFCTTEDTEILTEKGWVQWPNYNGSDLLGTVNTSNGMMEFQAPLATQVFEYKGEITYSTNRCIDFGVTPNHRMLVKKWDENKRKLSNEFSFTQAKDLGWYFGLPHAPTGYLGTEIRVVKIPGDKVYQGNEFFKMLGLIISDGYAGGTEKTNNWVSFASFRQDTRNDIYSLAKDIGFNESPSRKGVWVRYDAGALAQWIRANCYTGQLGAKHKRIPDIVKCASEEQIKIFLHYFDDRNRDGSQFYSTSKRLIDDLQELFLRIGKRSTIGHKDAKTTKFDGNKSGEIRSGESYVLTVRAEDRLSIDKKKHLTSDRYNGLVYCATVPNSTLITRRNGSVLISGNCWAYSTAHSIMASLVRDNQPCPRLSAHAVACKIKGFQDQGGWCGQSAEFARKYGYPTVGTWKEKSMSKIYDNEATWNEAKTYQIKEDYVDLAPNHWYYQNLTRNQLATMLLRNLPCPTDWNFWGHSVCAFRWVRVERGVYAPRILNSWAGWGKQGFADVVKQNGTPNSAVCTRYVSAI